VLVLFEGRYSGVVEPWTHYIPLRKDGANLDEVFAALADGPRVDAIAERAFEDIVASGRYSYASWVRMIDHELEAAASRLPSPALPASAAAPEGEPGVIRTRALRARPPTIRTVTAVTTPDPHWQPVAQAIAARQAEEEAAQQAADESARRAAAEVAAREAAARQEAAAREAAARAEAAAREAAARAEAAAREAAARKEAAAREAAAREAAAALRDALARAQAAETAAAAAAAALQAMEASLPERVAAGALRMAAEGTPAERKALGRALRRAAFRRAVISGWMALPWPLRPLLRPIARGGVLPAWRMLRRVYRRFAR
jgi:hypothetical protein